jgi:hypothetical protein
MHLRFMQCYDKTFLKMCAVPEWLSCANPRWSVYWRCHLNAFEMIVISFQSHPQLSVWHSTSHSTYAIFQSVHVIMVMTSERRSWCLSAIQRWQWQRCIHEMRHEKYLNRAAFWSTASLTHSIYTLHLGSTKIYNADDDIRSETNCLLIL